MRLLVQLTYTQFTPATPTRLNGGVESCRRWRCELGINQCSVMQCCARTAVSMTFVVHVKCYRVQTTLKIFFAMQW